MKTKLLNIIWILPVVVILAGCTAPSVVLEKEQEKEQEKDQDSTPDDTPEETPLELSISIQSPDPEISWSLGGEALAQLTSPKDWTLSSSEEWLQAQPSSGAKGEHNVTLKTPANISTEDRTAVLTLATEESSRQLSVVQHGNIFKITPLQSCDISSKMVFKCNPGVNRLKYVVFLPSPQTNQYQTIRNSRYGEGTQVISEEGVPYIVYYFDGSVTSEDIVLENTYTVDFQYLETDFSKIVHRDLPYDTESASYKRYTSRCTADAGYQMIDPLNPWVVAQADELWSRSGNDPVEYARLCYEKVALAFTYGIYDGDNSVDEIIDRMSGDCGNQHAIWLSLMRNKGIPARPVVMNSPDGFCHVRGEFCVAGYGWIPVDVTYHQGGGDYWGKFTDDHLVVMNRDFSFDTVPVGGESYHINLLQVIHWFYWYWGSGDVSGDYSMSYDVERTAVEWGITGTMVSPQWTTEAPIPMTLEGDWWVARDVALKGNDKFKFIHNNSWDVNRGGNMQAFGESFPLTQDGPDILPGISGSVDIYLSKDTYSAYIEKRN